MTDRRRLLRSLAADAGRLREINRFLVDPSNELIDRLLQIVERYGGPREINRKAEEAGRLENLLARLEQEHSPYRRDLDWLTAQRDRGAFVSMEEYCRRVRGSAGAGRVRAGRTPRGPSPSRSAPCSSSPGSSRRRAGPSSGGS